ncbi:Proline racemase [Penicillium cf. griseofulvum]|uniref:trans-L-3-hydroxyproline dehydratase n=1 Tax=Penicillium cf. griseofulvum TaxID=2972120 RepID=A0A9W9M3P4_9EURO|nr:Proline racemase [Penicillium cf. griseofulvum]KAJ5423034.1 Proline racemase [Penicillium cf. griseofulvum]KAJ5433748.1 Proline racemase [Penicillium cf. griseofulvum]
MEIPHPFQPAGPIRPIACVEMHTAGEPTRIIWNGIPPITGTLLEQRAQAKAHFDEFRRVLMLEPRGHYDMYGAILRPETELVSSGKAHIGVLFMHNEGFSTMCGHATIALGRFLVDADENVFPRRKELKYDAVSRTTTLNLHVPCGVVEVTVPVLKCGKSDASRPVSFVSVPSFATAISLQVPVPEKYRWAELRGKAAVTVDFAYGGAYYCMISAEELGFPSGLSEVKLQDMDHATKLLKEAVVTNPDLHYLTQDVRTAEEGFLYGIMITDTQLGHASASEGTAAARAQLDVTSEETGLCFFANQQIDRSPTGSCVAARVALAYAKGSLPRGEKRIYNSLVTRAYRGLSGFVGSVFDEAGITGGDKQSVRVSVEGYAYYTGYHSFVVEKEDGLGVDGFSVRDIAL